MAYKVFTNGSILADSDLNTYLMKQTVIVCTSGTRPGSPVEGMVVYETDTDRLSTYTGAAWQTAVATAPTWTAITGWTAGSNADATSVPQYSDAVNGMINLRGRVNATTTFAGAGVLIVTLPSGVRPNVERTWPVGRNYSASNTSDAKVSIASSGDLTLYCPASETTWFSLDGINFWKS
jgi:hypothetical protein